MIIAVKGYAGSGKTTISEMISQKYNFKIINADKIVYNLYKDNISLQEKIIQEFNLLEFNKKKLADIVFGNSEELVKLEKIIHPILTKKIQDEINTTTKNIILDCQVIEKLPISYDYEIYTTASYETLLKRIQKRDQKTEELSKKILANQIEFRIQQKKVFPINSEKPKKEIEDDLEKIMQIFQKEIKWNKENNEENK